MSDASTAPAEREAAEPLRVTFVLYDADTDGVAVLHNGEQVWQESTFDRFDQYLRFHAPLNQPIVIDHVTRD